MSNTKAKDSDYIGEIDGDINELLESSDDKNRNVVFADVYKQVIYSNLSFAHTIQSGVVLAYPNLLFGYFDDNTISWMASIGTLTVPAGSFLSGYLMEKIGRKWSHVAICVPHLISWTLLATANPDDANRSIISRFFGGIASGLATVNLVYASEISHGSVRPMLTSLVGVYFSFGILLTTFLAVYLTWDQVATFFAIFTISTTILTIIFLPESPYWLARQNDGLEEAKNTLNELNPNKLIMNREWSSILKKRTAEACENNVKISINSLLTNPTFYKPILLLITLIILQQLSGAYTTIIYASKIFPMIGHSLGQTLASQTLLSLGIIRFIFSVISTFLSFKYGRKILLTISSVGMTVSCLIIVFGSWTIENEIDSLATLNKISAESYLVSNILCDRNGSNIATKLNLPPKENILNSNIDCNLIKTNVSIKISNDSIIVRSGIDEEIFDAIAIFGFLSFVGTGALGVMGTVWALIPELLPTSLKGRGSGILISFSYVLMSAISKPFPILMGLIRVRYIFLFFCAISIVIAAFVNIYLPETYGKSISQVEEYFEKKSTKINPDGKFYDAVAGKSLEENASKL